RPARGGAVPRQPRDPARAAAPGVRGRGQGLPDHRARVHGGPPPVGGDRRGARPAPERGRRAHRRRPPGRREVTGMPADAPPHVVAVGGGHGLAATIRAVRRYAGRTTAVVSTADDGGSSGRLRSAIDMPAPGDVRRCVEAMAGASGHPLTPALEYRFDGTDLAGHALGNLLLAGLHAVTGDFVVATDELSRLLGIDTGVGRVLPATTEPVVLRAH